MIDIHIDTIDGSFKFRVCAIIRHKGKILVSKIHDNPFYCLPGGHVELGEDTISATKREVKEELSFDVNPTKLMFIMENFFLRKDGKQYHELSHYYLCELVSPKEIDMSEKTIFEQDKGYTVKHQLKWVDENEIKLIPFEPQLLQNRLFDNIENTIYIIDKNKRGNSYTDKYK